MYEKSGSTREFPKAPVVFHFRPKTYEVVTGERLREWERLMRENVGVAMDVSSLADTTSQTLSGGCGGEYPLCDCDVD